MYRTSKIYSLEAQHEKQLRTSSNSCKLHSSQEVQLFSKVHQEVLLMSEFEYFFYQDQAEFNRLYSSSLIYDFDSMEITKNEA